MEKTFREGNFLELAEARLKEQHKTFESLDQKAWQNISVSSIIIGLFVALNLQGTIQTSPPDLKLGTVIFLLVALVAYLVSFFIALWSRLPITFEYPIEMTWLVAVEALNEKTDEQYYAYLISSYMDAIANNDESLNSKADRVVRSTAMLGTSIAALVIAAIVQAI